MRQVENLKKKNVLSCKQDGAKKYVITPHFYGINGSCLGPLLPFIVSIQVSCSYRTCSCMSTCLWHAGKWI